MNVRLKYAFLVLLATTGCDAALSPQTCNVDVLADWPPETVTIYAGSLDGHAAEPLATISDPDIIAQLGDYFTARQDQWYLPAAEGSVAELVLIWGSGPDRAPRAVGVGVNYLETAGCNVRVIRHVGPRDRATLRAILFQAPMPAIFLDPETPI